MLSGEVITPARGEGIAFTLVGVVLAATSFSSPPSNLKAVLPGRKNKSKFEAPPGVGLALLASLGYGLTFWLLGFKVTPVLGGVAPVWVIRATTIVILLALSRPLSQVLVFPGPEARLLILAVGFLDTTAFVANTLGFGAEQVAVVSILASLFSVVTVFLAWIFLKEKLNWHQWLGIAIIFTGIILVSS